MQLFNFKGNQLRTVEMNGEPFFVAKDVCEILEVGNTSDAVRRLDDDEKGIVSIETPGGSQDVIGVNEPGLYGLILGSRKPEAKAFKRWIKHEVLPAIRKHGAYMTPETIEKTLHNPDFIIGLATRLKDETARADAATQEKLEFESQLKEQQPLLAIYNLAISAQNTMSMNEAAKALGTGRTRLYKLLREEGFIMKDSTLPYQRYVDAGYFKVIERPRASGDTVMNDPATRVYAKGFEAIAKMIQRRNITIEEA